jgi:hypothetical protein
MSSGHDRKLGRIPNPSSIPRNITIVSLPSSNKLQEKKCGPWDYKANFSEKDLFKVTQNFKTKEWERKLREWRN